MIGSCTNSGVSPTPAWSPVASGATMDEAQSAIDDTSDEGIVTSLGGALPESPTYTSAGLLNSFVQAGEPLADASSTGPYGTDSGSGLAAGVQSDDGAVLGAEDANAVPGASPASGYQSMWGNVLQSDPGMAGTVADDSLDQGLVSTLSVMA